MLAKLFRQRLTLVGKFAKERHWAGACISFACLLVDSRYYLANA